MGRLARPSRPPPSGAVIFYGRSSERVVSPRIKQQPSTDQHNEGITKSSLSSPPSSLSSKSTTDSNDKASTTSLPSQSSSTGLTSIDSTTSAGEGSDGFASKVALSSTTRRVALLLKDVSELFVHVPYVKIIAGVVLQILEITEEVHTGRQRARELIEKVMSYSRVIFEGLLALKLYEGESLADLKEDLEQITSVLQSIYSILQSSIVSVNYGRLFRIMNRTEDIEQIDQLNRRLDTCITSFQLKSSVVLRVNSPENSTTTERNISTGTPLQHSRSSLRPKPQIMFGRDEEIKTIVNAITSVESANIAILGSGGIGKTSLALSVLHNEHIITKYGSERVFVSCEAASSPDILVNELAFALGIAAENVTATLFNAILRRLQQNPYCLVLDNFETPWDNPQSRSQVESILTEITALENVSVIMTLRGSQYPASVDWSKPLPPLTPVDLDAAKKIFHAIAQKMDTQAIQLINAVDRVPLAVTLLANLAAVDGETTDALWKRWNVERTSMVESGDGRLSSLDASIRLSLSGSRMKRDPDALSFLSIIALLPDGMSKETLITCEKELPTVINVRKAVSTLRQNALVSEDANHTLRILSPIRLYTLAHHPTTPEARAFLQSCFIQLANQGLTTDDLLQKKMRREVGNIESMLLDSLSTHSQMKFEDVVGAILNFCHFTYASGLGSSRAIALVVERLQALESTTKLEVNSIVPKRPRLFGSRKVGFSRLFGRASQAPPQPDVKPHLKLQADCLGCWGQLLSRQSHFEEAEDKFSRAIRLHTRAGDVAGHAYDLHNLGCLLSREPEKMDAARRTFQDAFKLHEGINDQVGKAHDLMGSGHVLLQESKLDDAQASFTKALHIFTTEGDEPGLASALNSLGFASQSRSRFDECEKYFSQALEIHSKLGDAVGQAESLAGMACSFLLRSQFSKAQDLIDKAMTLRSPTPDPDRLHILGRIYIAQENFDTAESTLEDAKRLHEEIGDQLGQADDLLYLTDIKFQLGNLPFEMLEEARELYQARMNVIGQGNVFLFEGNMRLRQSQFETAQAAFNEALALHGSVDCTMGKASDLYGLGCLYLRMAEFEKATETLDAAYRIHKETGNVQGQADSLNKICESYLRRGMHHEAMTGIADALALHIQIGDNGGQGDDLYIQASIFLEQSRFDEAEKTIRKALELHKQSKVAFSIARDKATLSSILRGKGDGSSEHFEEIAQSLWEAMADFYYIGARGEGDQCAIQMGEWDDD